MLPRTTICLLLSGVSKGRADNVAARALDKEKVAAAEEERVWVVEGAVGAGATEISFQTHHAVCRTIAKRLFHSKVPLAIDLAVLLA